MLHSFNHSDAEKVQGCCHGSGGDFGELEAERALGGVGFAED